MTDECNPTYKNLNTIQSFSEQRYATVQWAQQNCENDEWLKQEVERLSYLTPPAVRKRFNPVLVDDNNSWGYQVNSTNNNESTYVSFSTSTDEDLPLINFDDFSMIDEEKSNCGFESYLDDGAIKRKAVVPKVETSTLDTSCRNSTGGNVNAYWYVGFDKNRNYQVRPDWLKHWLDGEIPCVCRAQTITIPSGISNGHWESVDLKIGNHGTGGSNWGSPLYVRICPVEARTIGVTAWNKATNRSEPVINPDTGKQQTKTVYFPKTTKDTLAYAVYDPARTSPSWQNFHFNKAIRVNTGERYAIVVSSPLSHWEHCPMVGGWGRNCATDKYSGGDAFLSEDNGVHWMLYGKNDDTLTAKEYKLGRLTPMDFAFQAHIRKYTAGRETEGEYFLYLKPIHANPIKKMTVVSNCYGNEASATDVDLTFEASQTGKAGDWHALVNGSINFTKNPTTDEYPHIVFLRARMSITDPDIEDPEETPYIEDIQISLDTETPSEMYVRTIPYIPKTSPMLGAALWGRVYAPFETEPTVTGSVEIIPEREVTEHFKIITAKELEDLVYEDGDTLVSTIEGLDPEKLTADPDVSTGEYTERYEYLLDDANAIQILKDHNYYVKPWTHLVDDAPVKEMLSFETGLQFVNSPAYPILSCSIQPTGTEPLDSYAEWVDYVFDYDNDVLMFNETLNIYEDDGSTIYEGPEAIPNGSLAVTYNPIFIQDLTNEEVGLREDDEGLILDYFKETFIISEADVENRYVQLRAAPVDPVRQVVHNKEELHEDIHFTVDYEQNRVKFPTIYTDNVTTRLSVGDLLEVVYTPNLEDTAISIGYRGRRENKDKQMKIVSNYIEYKV